SHTRKRAGQSGDQLTARPRDLVINEAAKFSKSLVESCSSHCDTSFSHVLRFFCHFFEPLSQTRRLRHYFLERPVVMRLLFAGIVAAGMCAHAGTIVIPSGNAATEGTGAADVGNVYLGSFGTTTQAFIPVSML